MSKTKSLSNIAGNLIQGINTEEDVKDILTFLEAPWGLNLNAETQPMLPAQRFILKLYYKLELDNVNKTIQITDKFNERALYHLTEAEYLNYLYQEGRCNIRFIDDKPRNELVLIIGRRGTKCAKHDAPITTTEGTISYLELLTRISNKEKIGIFTYNPETWEKYITYKIKAEDNGIRDCIRITTKLGRSEECTQEHPYLVWRENWSKPEWVQLIDVRVGDTLALAKSQEMFGNTSLGEEFSSTLGLISNEEGIPTVIKKAPRKEISLFLNSVLSGRSVLSKSLNKVSLNISLSSKKLTLDIQRELLKFSIICEITPLNKQYILSISEKESIINFIYEIDNKLAQSITPEDLNLLSQTPLTDHQSILTKDYYKKFSSSQIIWDEVIDLKEIGKHSTVALEVEDTSIIGNDIISHNSTIASWVAAYEAYKLLKTQHPQKYYKMLPDAEIHLTCIATSEDQANLLFRQVLGHFSQCNYYHRYMNKPTADKVLIRSRRDLEKYGEEGRSSIVVKSAPCSARALRGAGNILVVMDEQAHFVDEKTQSNKSDKAVYDALTPSVAQFGRDGKIVNISSPLNKSGVLWDLYNQALSGSDNILMIQAPSWEINNTLDSSFLRSRYQLDPIVYDCEFGAQFSDRVKSWMPEEYLKNVIVKKTPSLRGSPRTPYFMGVDIGLKGDGTAIAICHISKEKNSSDEPIEVIELDSVSVIKAEDFGKDILDFDDIIKLIQDYSQRFYIVKGILDQHNGALAVQGLSKKGLTQFDLVYHTRNLNSDMYQNFMMQVIDRKIRIYDDNPIAHEYSDLIEEILKLQVHQYSRNVIEVQAPRIKGHHDDRSDAIVRAVWLASQALKDGLVGSSLSQFNNTYSNIYNVNQFQLMKQRLHNIPDNRRSIRRHRDQNWKRYK